MTTNNHPAHGPVSLDRLHQISEILSKAAAQSDGGNLGYAMADAVKVINGVIAEFEEQENPRPVMAIKGELGFIDNLEKIIEERDEDIDIGQLGRSNYDALMLAALDAFRASPPAVPSAMSPVVEGGKIIAYERHGERFSTTVGAAWNTCRTTMLQAGNSPSKCSLREGIEAIRNSGIPVDVDKIQSECDAGNSPATPDSSKLPPQQPLIIDSIGTLRFKENQIVRRLLDYATERGYGLNEIAREQFDAEDQMQLAQLIGYSLDGYGTLSYVTDESYERAAAVQPQREVIIANRPG